MEQVQNNLETTETEAIEGAEYKETLKRVNKMLDERLQEFTKDLDEKMNHIKLVEEENKSLKCDIRKNEVMEMLRAAKVDTRAIELLDINAADVEEKIKLLNDIIDIKVLKALQTDMKNNEYIPGPTGPGGIKTDTLTEFEKVVRG